MPTFGTLRGVVLSSQRREVHPYPTTQERAEELLQAAQYATIPLAAIEKVRSALPSADSYAILHTASGQVILLDITFRKLTAKLIGSGLAIALLGHTTDTTP